jgi:hypothetical protein
MRKLREMSYYGIILLKVKDHIQFHLGTVFI